MQTYTKQNIIDLLYGCAVLGTGGGGGLKEGLDLMEEDFKNNRELRVIDVADIPDDAYIATPYGCGAPAPEGENELPEKYKRLPQIKDSSAKVAFEGLEKFLGQKFFALSSTELGGLNTAEALHIACLLGLPIADADPAGRSVPELQHTTYFVKGVPIAPMGVASDFGDVVIVSEVVDDFRAEELVRALAVASNDVVGVADHPTTGKIYRESVIVGALSYARKIGETLRAANEAGENAAKKITEAVGGAILFEGSISDTSWETKDGFNFGEIYIDGNEKYKDEQYKIWYKNENLMSYRNGKVDVTCPDLICLIDKNGTPVTNPDGKVGQEVTAFVLPSPEIWQTEKGLECFGPRSFGFDVDYVPYIK